MDGFHLVVVVWYAFFARRAVSSRLNGQGRTVKSSGGARLMAKWTGWTKEKLRMERRRAIEAEQAGGGNAVGVKRCVESALNPVGPSFMTLNVGQQQDRKQCSTPVTSAPSRDTKLLSLHLFSYLPLLCLFAPILLLSPIL
ncbi:uncharacterized protein J3D65DRAFT_152392 [Phyllosticta citribraziliensis]|uniref:Uncharacterized protein n=1 Tax=Phyllosticta citribraziliensis TaxID=989973 RepID=A0ABR1L4Y6_9PEZI